MFSPIKLHTQQKSVPISLYPEKKQIPLRSLRRHRLVPRPSVRPGRIHRRDDAARVMPTTDSTLEPELLPKEGYYSDILKAKQAPKSKPKNQACGLPAVSSLGRSWSVTSSSCSSDPCPPRALTLKRGNAHSCRMLSPGVSTHILQEACGVRTPPLFPWLPLSSRPGEQPADKGAAPLRQFLSEPVRVSGLLA